MSNHVTTRGSVAVAPFHPHSHVADQYALGLAGEEIAIRWYEDMGFALIDARVRCRAGEIDAVLQAPDETIVFLEVKTRRSTQFGGAEAVSEKKLRTMRRCAGEWLAKHDAPYLPIQFDVCEVIFDGHRYTARRFEGVEDGAC